MIGYKIPTTANQNVAKHKGNGVRGTGAPSKIFLEQAKDLTKANTSNQHCFDGDSTHLISVDLQHTSQHVKLFNPLIFFRGEV